MSDDSRSIFRQESLERLSSPEQLDQLMQIVNSRSWLALATLAALVLSGLIWSVVGRIPIAVTGKGVLVHPTDSSDELLSLTYFEAEQGEQIRPGMEVRIVPSGVGAEGSGVVGHVQAVSGSAVTTLDAARQSDAVGQSIEVLVALDWPSASGNQVELKAGMTATTRITIAQTAPIAFAFPFLKTDQ